MKHTPGPWEKVSDTCVTDSDGVMLAEVNYGRPKEEYVANAQLIAAAPDMLEVLSTIINQYTELPAEVMEEVAPYWLPKAMAAIVKAKGE